MKRLLILGATGSIGTTTLSFLRQNHTEIKVVGLTAHSSIEKLKTLSEEFKTPSLIIDDNYNGLDSFIDSTNPDIVLNAISGSSGLYPSLLVLSKGIDLALANKESVVLGGNYLFKVAKSHNANIIPVDSEHSAIYHLIQNREIDKIILTCSGGPFLNRKDLENVKLEDALKHPTWSMGKKITIDSATLANKGLEVIEAHYLFDVKKENIEVVIHPESIVHSLIRQKDGSLYALLSNPDMTLPIISAILGENKIENLIKPLDLSLLTLHFLAPDYTRFPMLPLSYRALDIGGSARIAYNTANEVAVDAFIKDKISFLNIPRVVSNVVENPIFKSEANNYQEIMEAYKEAKRITEEKIWRP